MTIFHLLVESAMVVLRIFCFQQFFRKILLTLYSGGVTNITETLSQVVSLSLLAMLPSPIFYGVIIDNTCLLWQEVTIVSKITYT